MSVCLSQSMARVQIMANANRPRGSAKYQNDINAHHTNAHQAGDVNVSSQGAGDQVFVRARLAIASDVVNSITATSAKYVVRPKAQTTNRYGFLLGPPGGHLWVGIYGWSERRKCPPHKWVRAKYRPLKTLEKGLGSIPNGDGILSLQRAGGQEPRWREI